VDICKPRTSQPGGGTAIDLANPVTRGLVAVYAGTRGLNGFVGGALTPTSSPAIIGGPRGLGFSGGSGGYYTLPASLSTAISATKEGTFLAVMQGGTAADQGFGSFSGNTGSDDHYPFGGAIYLSVLSLRRWVGGATPQVDVTVPHTLIVQSRNGSQRATQNNLLLGASTFPDDATLDSSQAYLIKSRDLSFAYSGSQPLVAFWNRYLSDAEVAVLHANPWQIFAPLPRRMWMASPSGAAAVFNPISGRGGSAAQPLAVH
jgi:hypothetical protein